MTTDPTETARALLYRHGLPEDIVDGALALHAQELAAVLRREAAVWGVDTAAGKHVLAAADLTDPAKSAARAAAGPAPATGQAACPRCVHDERTRGVLQLSALELYPPDHTPDCPSGLRDRIAALFRCPPGAERLGDATPGEIAAAVLAVLPASTDQAALREAQQEIRRLKLTVDEYGQGASALTDKLRRVRAMHRETCPFATGVMPAGVSCSMCDLLDAPAAPVPPAPDARADDLLRRTEAYLSAMHGSVARHDNLGEGLGCAGCELRDQIRAGLRRLADETPQQREAWTPPPPGDTREQLPDHLLELLDMPLYLSTACQTEGQLRRRISQHGDPTGELAAWAERLDARCRHNQKFTGQRCICPVHTAAVAQPDEEA